MVNFHADNKVKDKRGNHIIPTTDITTSQLAIIKNAIKKVPRNPPEVGADELDKRLDMLYEKPIEDWSMLGDQEIRDLKQAVNKKLQDDEAAGVQADPVLVEWKDKLHEIWKITNPS